MRRQRHVLGATLLLLVGGCLSGTGKQDEDEDEGEQTDDTGSASDCADREVGDTFVDVSLGQTAGCALDDAGIIHCWGDSYGALVGQDISSEPCHRALVTGGGWGWYDFACALGADQRPTCWGYVDMEDPETPQHPVVTDVPDIALESLVAGGDFACGLDAGGMAWCWGGGTNDTSAVVEALTGSGPYVELTAGWETVCGRTEADEFACTSVDRFGEERDQPGGRVAAVRAYGLTVCAIAPGGTIDCWGQHGEDNGFVPAEFIAEARDVVHVTGDHSDQCILDAAGTAACARTTFDAEAPAPTGTYTTIESGLFASCGVRPDGSLHCWGDVDQTQLSEAPTLP